MKLNELPPLSPSSESPEVSTGKTSPLPWVYKPLEFDDWGFVRDANLSLVARAVCLASEREQQQHRLAGTDPYEANARFIVLAVNSHADLVAALKAVVDLLAKEAPGTRLNSHEFDHIGIQCHAALAKALR